MPDYTLLLMQNYNCIISNIIKSFVIIMPNTQRMKMKLAKKLLYITGAALLLGSTALSAKVSEAKAITQNMFDYVGSLEKFAFDAIVINDDIQDGKNVKHTHNVSVKVDRPDRFRIDVKGDIKNRSSYLNGGTYTMIDHGFNYYGQLKTAKNIDATLDQLFEQYGIQAPLAQLIYSDMRKRSKMRRSKYFGKVTLDGVECDYVAFANKNRIVHIWIERGDKPLVKHFVIIDKTAEGNPRSETAIKWNLNAKISDSDFIFAAPKGASKISVESGR